MQNSLFTKPSATNSSEIKPLFFWRHNTDLSNIDEGCFSQWYPSPFVVDDVKYATAEHWMMAQKAALFKDDALKADILAADHPALVQKLGRKIQNYQQAIWDAEKFDIVVRGNVEKFGQSDALLQFLLGTKERLLVEASPMDRIWGIGLGKEDAMKLDPADWRGQNLLGKALMQARTLLLSR